MKWSYFPRNNRISEEHLKVVNAFIVNESKISSENQSLHSDEVLHIVANELEKLGYIVEKSKKDKDKIKMPVLYGECGIPTVNFETDVYNKDTKTVIEVEAGRGVTNYQFLKDFFESCCMDNTDYLCIAVRLKYRISNDYEKVCSFFEALYASNRFMIPLKGILIIGY